MSEEKNTQIGEETGQSGQPVGQEESRDYEAQYNAEVATAIKQRKRAQDAEKKLIDIQSKLEAKEEEKLIADGKLQEAYDSLKAENKRLKSEFSQSTEIVENVRASLMEKVPEEEREALEGLPFKTLKMVVEKMTTIPASALPNTTPGVKYEVPAKPYTEMSDAEKRQYHASKLNN